MNEIQEKEARFPWIGTTIRSFQRCFGSDYDMDALALFHRNIEEEIKFISNVHGRNYTIYRAQALYGQLYNVYEHMRYKINEHSEFPNATLSCVKLLSQIIRTGLVLTQGLKDSDWTTRNLIAIKFFTGKPDLIYDALLLVTNLKKLYHPPYAVLLKSVLIEDQPECTNTDPLAYMKIILLFRRLNNISKEKYHHTKMKKIKPPFNLISWLVSLGANGASKLLLGLKYKTAAKQLLKEESLPESLLQKIRDMALHPYSFVTLNDDHTVREIIEDPLDMFIIDKSSANENRRNKKKLKSLSKKSNKTTEENARAEKSSLEIDSHVSYLNNYSNLVVELDDTEGGHESETSDTCDEYSSENDACRFVLPKCNKQSRKKQRSKVLHQIQADELEKKAVNNMGDSEDEPSSENNVVWKKRKIELPCENFLVSNIPVKRSVNKNTDIPEKVVKKGATTKSKKKLKSSKDSSKSKLSDKLASNDGKSNASASDLKNVCSVLEEKVQVSGKKNTPCESEDEITIVEEIPKNRSGCNQISTKKTLKSKKQKSSKKSDSSKLPITSKTKMAQNQGYSSDVPNVSKDEYFRSLSLKEKKSVSQTSSPIKKAKVKKLSIMEPLKNKRQKSSGESDSAGKVTSASKKKMIKTMQNESYSPEVTDMDKGEFFRSLSLKEKIPTSQTSSPLKESKSVVNRNLEQNSKIIDKDENGDVSSKMSESKNHVNVDSLETSENSKTESCENTLNSVSSEGITTEDSSASPIRKNTPGSEILASHPIPPEVVESDVDNLNNAKKSAVQKTAEICTEFLESQNNAELTSRAESFTPKKCPVSDNRNNSVISNISESGGENMAEKSTIIAAKKTDFENKSDISVCEEISKVPQTFCNYASHTKSKHEAVNINSNRLTRSSTQTFSDDVSHTKSEKEDMNVAITDSSIQTDISFSSDAIQTERENEDEINSREITHNSTQTDISFSNDTCFNLSSKVEDTAIVDKFNLNTTKDSVDMLFKSPNRENVLTVVENIHSPKQTALSTSPDLHSQESDTNSTIMKDDVCISQIESQTAEKQMVCFQNNSEIKSERSKNNTDINAEHSPLKPQQIITEVRDLSHENADSQVENLNANAAATINSDEIDICKDDASKTDEDVNQTRSALNSQESDSNSTVMKEDVCIHQIENQKPEEQIESFQNSSDIKSENEVNMVIDSESSSLKPEEIINEVKDVSNEDTVNQDENLNADATTTVSAVEIDICSISKTDEDEDNQTSLSTSPNPHSQESDTSSSGIKEDICISQIESQKAEQLDDFQNSSDIKSETENNVDIDSENSSLKPQEIINEVKDISNEDTVSQVENLNANASAATSVSSGEIDICSNDISKTGAEDEDNQTSPKPDSQESDTNSSEMKENICISQIESQEAEKQMAGFQNSSDIKSENENNVDIDSESSSLKPQEIINEVKDISNEDTVSQVKNLNANASTATTVSSNEMDICSDDISKTHSEDEDNQTSLKPDSQEAEKQMVGFQNSSDIKSENENNVDIDSESSSLKPQEIINELKDISNEDTVSQVENLNANASAATTVSSGEIDICSDDISKTGAEDEDNQTSPKPDSRESDSNGSGMKENICISQIESQEAEKQMADFQNSSDIESENENNVDIDSESSSLKPQEIINELKDISNEDTVGQVENLSANTSAATTVSSGEIDICSDDISKTGPEDEDNQTNPKPDSQESDTNSSGMKENICINQIESQEAEKQMADFQNSSDIKSENENNVGIDSESSSLKAQEIINEVKDISNEDTVSQDKNLNANTSAASTVSSDEMDICSNDISETNTKKEGNIGEPRVVFSDNLLVALLTPLPCSRQDVRVSSLNSQTNADEPQVENISNNESDNQNEGEKVVSCDNDTETKVSKENDSDKTPHEIKGSSHVNSVGEKEAPNLCVKTDASSDEVDLRSNNALKPLDAEDESISNVKQSTFDTSVSSVHLSVESQNFENAENVSLSKPTVCSSSLESNTDGVQINAVSTNKPESQKNEEQVIVHHENDTSMEESKSKQEKSEEYSHDVSAISHEDSVLQEENLTSNSSNLTVVSSNNVEICSLSVENQNAQNTSQGNIDAPLTGAKNSSLTEQDICMSNSNLKSLEPNINEPKNFDGEESANEKMDTSKECLTDESEGLTSELGLCSSKTSTELIREDESACNSVELLESNNDNKNSYLTSVSTESAIPEKESENEVISSKKFVEEKANEQIEAYCEKKLDSTKPETSNYEESVTNKSKDLNIVNETMNKNSSTAADVSSMETDSLSNLKSEDSSSHVDKNILNDSLNKNSSMAADVNSIETDSLSNSKSGDSSSNVDKNIVNETLNKNSSTAADVNSIERDSLNNSKSEDSSSHVDKNMKFTSETNSVSLQTTEDQKHSPGASSSGNELNGGLFSGNTVSMIKGNTPSTLEKETELEHLEISKQLIGKSPLKRLSRLPIYEYIPRFCKNNSYVTFSDISVKDRDTNLDVDSGLKSPITHFASAACVETFSMYRNDVIHDENKSDVGSKYDSVSRDGALSNEPELSDETKSQGLSSDHSDEDYDSKHNSCGDEDSNDAEVASGGCSTPPPVIEDPSNSLKSKDKDLPVDESERVGSVCKADSVSSAIEDQSNSSKGKNEDLPVDESERVGSVCKADSVSSAIEDQSNSSKGKNEDLPVDESERIGSVCKADSISSDKDACKVEDSGSCLNETSKQSKDTRKGEKISEEALPRHSRRLRNKAEIKHKTDTEENKNNDIPTSPSSSQKELSGLKAADECSPKSPSASRTELSEVKPADRFSHNIDESVSSDLKTSSNVTQNVPDLLQTPTKAQRPSRKTALTKSLSSRTRSKDNSSKASQGYSLRSSRSSRRKDDSSILDIDLNKLQLDSPAAKRSTRSNRVSKFLKLLPPDIDSENTNNLSATTKQETHPSVAESEKEVVENTPSYNLRNRKSVLAPAKLKL